MYRSASTSRVIDDSYSYYTISPTSKVPTALRALYEGPTDLPIHDPQSDPAMKEKARTKFAEKAVHLIPLVLLLCGLILWLFSGPNVNIEGNEAMRGKVKGMAIDGDLDSDATRHLPEHLGDAVKGKLGDVKMKFAKTKFMAKRRLSKFRYE